MEGSEFLLKVVFSTSSISSRRTTGPDPGSEAPEGHTQFKQGGLLLSTKVVESETVVRFDAITNWEKLPGVTNCVGKAREFKMIYKICLNAEKLLDMNTRWLAIMMRVRKSLDTTS